MFCQTCHTLFILSWVLSKYGVFSTHTFVFSRGFCILVQMLSPVISCPSLKFLINVFCRQVPLAFTSPMVSALITMTCYRFHCGNIPTALDTSSYKSLSAHILQLVCFAVLIKIPHVQTMHFPSANQDTSKTNRLPCLPCLLKLGCGTLSRFSSP